MSEQPVQPLHDPAGPPRAVDDDPALFSWLQVGAAALFGTPITAGVLWSINARALGWRSPWVGVVVGAVATLVPVVVAHWLRSPFFVIAVFALWPTLAAIANDAAFGSVAPHRRRSHIGVVLGIVAVVVVLVKTETLLKVRGVLVPIPENLPATTVHAGSVSVTLGDGVSMDDGDRAARFLDQAGFARVGQLALRLGRDDKGYVARLRVPAPVDEAVLASGRSVGRALATALGECVTTSLVRAEDDLQLASGRSCP
ncbi:MAG: hypothetical protein Q8O67_17485 [Deltaproteobacteria bacterium]|nr:hypothetical protein [Deltaproteobacteria bacterium]